MAIDKSNKKSQKTQYHMINNNTYLIKSFKYVYAWLMDVALASNPDVGSSMNFIEGLATTSTAIVSLLRYLVERPLTPGKPTKASLSKFNSTSSMTSSMNICNHFRIQIQQ
ncbi:hypothetical protein GLYMA_14G133850v4 [Glycine max]|nr:hypothetical protein GLYMA_14G133850v4 [Glycine max]KAH1094335.1 hypothetical protein GYH30_039858 [Glycine max]